MKKPEGVLSNVLVQVKYLFVPADFVVVDYEEDQEMPILLGRPFLDTADASLKMRRRIVKMKIGGEKIMFNADEVTKFPRDNLIEQVSMIDSIEDEREEVMEAMSNLMQQEIDNFYEHLSLLTEPMTVEESQSFESLHLSDYLKVDMVSKGSPGSSKVSPPSLELKQLPSHLSTLF